MKELLSLLSVGCVGTLVAASTITVGSVSQNADTRDVTVSYTLEGDPAIVTFDVTTNGASVGGANLACAYGGVNRLLAAGAYVFTWKPDFGDIGAAFAGGTAKVSVNAWATNAPPAYMAINLLHPEIRRFYDSAEAIPGGVTQTVYKTDWMVFRRIPAKDIVWRMGNNPTTDTGNWETFHYHNVMFTDDYYMSVFEVTRAQYYLAQNWGNYYSFSDANDMAKPVLKNSAYSLRGNVKFPESDVQSNSTVGRMRSFLGLPGLEVPTFAQWEYAARAGKGTQWFFGETDEKLGDYAWYDANAGGSVHDVGMKKPNAFGLYDIYGNADEPVRESTAAYYGLSSNIRLDASLVATNPAGPATCGFSGMSCGGNFSSGTKNGVKDTSRLTSWKADGFTYSNTPNNAGIRLVAPAVVPFTPETED